MAETSTRIVAVDEEEVKYKVSTDKNGYWIDAPKLNQFFVLTLERADNIVARATRIRRKYPTNG